MLKAVNEIISKLPAPVRPPPVAVLEELHLVLAGVPAAPVPAAETEQHGPTEAEQRADDAEAATIAKYHQKKLKELEKQVQAVAEREQVGPDGMHLVMGGEGFPLISMMPGGIHGLFNCELCAKPKRSGKVVEAAEHRAIDSGFGGVLRHICGPVHVKNWLAQNPDENVSYDDMKAKLPPKYSGDRCKRTTQHAAAVQQKVVKQKTKEVSDAVLAAMQASKTPTTPFMTQGPAAEPRAEMHISPAPMAPLDGRSPQEAGAAIAAAVPGMPDLVPEQQ